MLFFGLVTQGSAVCHAQIAYARYHFKIGSKIQGDTGGRTQIAEGRLDTTTCPSE